MPNAPQNLQGGLPAGFGMGGLGNGPDALASVRLLDNVTPFPLGLYCSIHPPNSSLVLFCIS